MLLASTAAILFVYSYHSMEWSVGWEMLHPTREGTINKYFSLVTYLGQLCFYSLSEKIF